MASTRQRITNVRNPTLVAPPTPEQRYWRGFGHTQLVKEHSSVTNICFNPISPHDFAVTSSTRVQLFSSKTRQVVKTFSRFKDTVYSGEFRHDGKLLVAGDASGLVQIFHADNPRSLLVSFKPSSYPTHVTKFHPNNNSNLLTASDDRIVRLYDITNTDKALVQFSGHDDYVRSASFIPGTNLITTGSYDGIVRIWDPREDGHKPITSLDQNFAVEDLMSLSSTNLISCGGPSVKVWDLSSNKLIQEMNNFTKTVTCLYNAAERGILAGSIDGHVKVFDTNNQGNYEVKYGWKFGSGVLSCGVSPNNKHFVAGLNSGLLAIRTRKTESKPKAVKVPKSGNFAQVVRGNYHGESENRIINDKPMKQSKRLKKFERDLIAFKWSDALDSCLSEEQGKEMTVSCLEELRKKGKVRVALNNRSEATLEPLLSWCCKYVDDVKLVTLIADYLAIVLEMYPLVFYGSPILEETLRTVQRKVSQEIEKAKAAQVIEGMLSLLSVK
ncbi:BA75_04210T0 [Komagataella pastoris]|uniref:BA75_04210T0 n=1 Tax=Komagataella pastoris TaxID=4922 RepID=A0A1B2JH39_PICPA|nr:BA75_04210T0 [Komagataella pastoris]